MSQHVDFKALKAVSLEQAISFLNELKLSKREGDQLRFACPACGGDNKRALSVNLDKGFRCFTSSKSGSDAVALVAHVRNVGQREAGAMLQEHFLGSVTSQRGSALPPRGGGASHSTKRGNAPATGSNFSEITDRLEFDHPAIEALGLEEQIARAIGIGYDPDNKRVMFPLHVEQKQVGYAGLATSPTQAPLVLFDDRIQFVCTPHEEPQPENVVDFRKFFRNAS